MLSTVSAADIHNVCFFNLCISYVQWTFLFLQNFLALCASDYYNGCLFHRNIKGFIVQTGDPTHTGKGGNSIWGRKFEDEFKDDIKVCIHSKWDTPTYCWLAVVYLWFVIVMCRFCIVPTKQSGFICLINLSLCNFKVRAYSDNWKCDAMSIASCMCLHDVPRTALPLTVHIVLSDWSLEIAAWSIKHVIKIK